MKRQEFTCYLQELGFIDQFSCLSNIINVELKMRPIKQKDEAAVMAQCMDFNSEQVPDAKLSFSQ
jgi:hypothetical protein